MPANVKPVPEGYHTLTPYLIVKDAARAIDFYKKALGAQQVVLMHGPDGKSIMHAELKIGDSMLMLSEEWPGRSQSPESLGGTPVFIHLYVNDVDSVFNQAVKAGATVQMPLEDAFWGDRYGQVKDPFGHAWSLATHKKDLSQEEMQKAAEVAMRQMGQKAQGGG